MCLAIPAQIIKFKANDIAVITVAGVEKEVSLALLDESIKVGDYVIVHVGYALSKLDEVAAQKSLADFNAIFKEEVKL